jgi:hypothetical protein
MKKITTILAIALLLFSCSPNVSRDQAIQYKMALSELSNPNVDEGQTFIDAATAVILELNQDPNCNIDFEHIFKLLEVSTVGNNRALLQLEVINEIDTDINFRDNIESYLQTKREVLLEFENCFTVLQRTRDPQEIEELLQGVLFTKLTEMKKKQSIVNQSQEEFNNKYDL